MKGYIYTMYAGADPGHGWVLNDPIFTPVPTLGACVPHIRRTVDVDDFIFAISGRIPGERQFIVGGFRVAEKIDALAAYHRFPQYRLHSLAEGGVGGNVIVTPQGDQHPLDHHENFERRVENYIVGADPTYLRTNAQYTQARVETLPILQEIFDRDGERVFDVIGRQRRMDSAQVEGLLAWLRSL